MSKHNVEIRYSVSLQFSKEAPPVVSLLLEPSDQWQIQNLDIVGENCIFNSSSD